MADEMNCLLIILVNSYEHPFGLRDAGGRADLVESCAQAELHIRIPPGATFLGNCLILQLHLSHCHHPCAAGSRSDGHINGQPEGSKPGLTKLPLPHAPLCTALHPLQR